MATPPAATRRRFDDPTLRIGCGLLLLPALLFGLSCSGLMGLGMLAMSPGHTVLAAVLAGLTTVPYGALLLWLDRNEKEPWWLIAGAFLWGAVVATAFSGLVNDVFGGMALGVVGNEALAGQLTASISAPLIEELTKGVAVAFIFVLFPRQFDNVLDGILYGALVGLGFAWFENIIYYINAGATGGVGEMITLAWGRGVLSGIGSHAAYTGLTGAAFGLVRVIRTGALRWLLVPVFWSAAMFAHFIWNTFVGLFIFDPTSAAMIWLVSMPVAVVVLQLPFVALLGVAMLFIWRHENAVIVAYLADEELEITSPAEVAMLVPARRRVLAGVGRFFGRGPLAWWRGRAMEHDLISLSFVKWHLHRNVGVDWDPNDDLDVQGLRARILARRRALGSPP